MMEMADLAAADAELGPAKAMWSRRHAGPARNLALDRLDQTLVHRRISVTCRWLVAGDVLNLVRARRGHFALESGHHADLWFDLESLCLQPARMRPLAAQLAARVRPYEIDMVCGPLVEGAYVGLMVAEELGVEFVYAERIAHPGRAALFPVEYRLPATLRPLVRGKRMAIVNDVISAGSAVRGALTDVRDLGATVAAVSALVVLGDAFPAFAAERRIALEALTRQTYELWEPAACPMCAAGVPLERPGD
jgi:orotate phosphoribosyltransferase